MCGICGKLIFKNIIPSKELIQSMCNTIIHRGPDDEGVYTAPNIGLGQRRLSIIDLQTSACPPLSNEDETIWLCFNGEIYNYKDLRNDLLNKGHNFRTNTDTEVIIHLYEEEGFECLQKLRGMFAFALWDEKKGLLFCARDRMGKKPFNYCLNSESFIFGSEIKAITADPSIKKEPDYYAIDQYLTYQFVPSPLTAFKGINKLGAAEYLTCDLKGNLIINKYWEPKLSEKIEASKEEIENEILNKLRESVKLRMISDVPLGAFLSGGIDSATIVALMSEESSKPVKTFSIGFEENVFNELPYARMIAKQFKTDHCEMVIKPNVEEVIPILVKHYNEPFADSSALPSYYVSEMTKKHVSVALSGDGGDESFAGYTNYGTLLSWNKWNAYPLTVRKIIAGGMNSILDSIPYQNTISKWKRGLSMVSAQNIKERRLQFGTILKTDEKRVVYTSLFKDLILRDRLSSDTLAEYKWSYGMDDLDWLMRHDQNFYLPDCLMVKSDIASMANGLEVRSPFLDHKFVEFAATIPSEYKRNGNNSKIILKDAVRHMLPEQILGKRKTGFGIPLAKWFRTELSPLLKEVLLSEKTKNRGLFEPSIIMKMVKEHIDGKRDWSTRLWAFVFLELWFREFID